jgi:RNA polymerase sigma-70 factor (ECF subfamily)
MSPNTASFTATRWTLVQRSCGDDTEAKAALSELCEAYYTPVVTFLQRDGRAEDSARELAHAFFERLLAGKSLQKAVPEKGKFRSYLLGALKHFLSDQRIHNGAAKRGGNAIHQSIDLSSQVTDTGLQIADTTIDSPDAAYDKQWALTLLARALADLSQEMTADGKQAHFETLKPWLIGDDSTRQSAAAAALGISENAVKVAVHRLRQRFRETVKAQIAQTVDDPAQVREELTHLQMALRA